MPPESMQEQESLPPNYHAMDDDTNTLTPPRRQRSKLFMRISMAERGMPEAEATSPLTDYVELTASSASTADDRSATAAPEEKILSLVDQMEDEFEEHTYEELLPIEIKLAIEKNVFGWSHLTSNILGHVAFTAGAFGIVYLILWRMAPSYLWLRWITAVWAAGSSYRMVRRRRQVWLRAPYGSQKYREDVERRKREVEEADRSSWLGRLRRQRRRKKVERQLKRAEHSFYKHHTQRLSRVIAEPPDSPSEGSEDEGQAPLKHTRRPSFRTDALPSMQSVQLDQIVFSHGPITRMLYTHGGFFGAAPFLLANPHWISTLRHLMPDVYVEISRRVLGLPPPELIRWAENNPVIASFASAYQLEQGQDTGFGPSTDRKVPAIEWDVWVDPAIVHSVNVILRERDKFLKSNCPELLDCDAFAKPFAIDKASLEELSPANRGILRYYNAMLKTRVRLLVDEMLIAHGNLTQLALEQTGIAKQYIYSRVSRTRRTLGGGIYARQWMAVYAEALRLGVETPSTSPVSEETERRRSTLDPMASETCPDMSISEAVSVVKSITKTKDPIGLVLDLKSRHVPKHVWACVVDTLREDGIRLEGVGAFVTDEIRGLSMYTAEPVREILFFHSAGDLQRACHDGRIMRGDTVLFNAGSLLSNSACGSWNPSSIREQLCSGFDAHRVKRSYRLMPFAKTTPPEDATAPNYSGSSSTIEVYKRHFNMSIGLYVQEFAIDEAAANLLVDYVNENLHIYDLGLNWGGINGITIRGIQPDRFTATDGFWNQRYIGAEWDLSLTPPYMEHPSSRLD